jgi:hypothetical protein
MYLLFNLIINLILVTLGLGVVGVSQECPWYQIEESDKKNLN